MKHNIGGNTKGQQCSIQYMNFCHYIYTSKPNTGGVNAYDPFTHILGAMAQKLMSQSCAGKYNMICSEMYQMQEVLRDL